MSPLSAPGYGLSRRFAVLLTAVALMAMAISTPAVRVSAQDVEQTPRSIVVTTEVLGAVVRSVVGDAAEVLVLMDGGANPHTFEASARDAEHILAADLLVSNGLDLEEGLLAVLEMAHSEGVTWFEAADHVAVRGIDTTDEAGDGDDHDLGVVDPHIWTDPLAMRDVVAALVPVLADVGIDVTAQADDAIAELERLDGEISHILADIPPDERMLVTGHRSMGYFADRYGFEQVGTVIPSLSTSGEPTARQLAQLIADIRDNDVVAVFAEVGTPGAVAEAVAADSGAKLVTLSTSQLPADGSYASFMLDIATTVAEALRG